MVTPSNASAVKAGDTTAAAGTSLASAVTQAAQQQAQVIGVRTLLEFVAWLVCSSSPRGGVPAVASKQAAQAGMNSRRGAVFLTEELSDVGIAVRRMQVSTVQIYTLVYNFALVLCHRLPRLTGCTTVEMMQLRFSLHVNIHSTSQQNQRPPCCMLNIEYIACYNTHNLVASKHLGIDWKHTPCILLLDCARCSNLLSRET